MRADPVDESELHAYVDGELEADERRRIEDHLHKHQEDAALVEGWRRQNAALRAAFAQTVKEPLPPTLRSVTKGGLSERFGSGVNWARFSPSKASSLRTLRRPDTSRRIQRRPMIAMSLLTALVGALIAGGALLAFTSPATPPGDPATRAPSFVERAELTYRTYSKDARTVEIGAERIAELSAWLSDRVGFGAPPDLTVAGLELQGGRVVPGAQGPAGFLLYRSAEGAPVGLYFERVAGAERASGPPPRPAQGLEVVEWRAGGRAFVLLGSLGAETIRAAAEIAARASR